MSPYGASIKISIRHPLIRQSLVRVAEKPRKNKVRVAKKPKNQPRGHGVTRAPVWRCGL